MILEGFVIIVSRDDWLNRVCGNVMARRTGEMGCKYNMWNMIINSAMLECHIIQGYGN